MKPRWKPVCDLARVRVKTLYFRHQVFFLNPVLGERVIIANPLARISLPDNRLVNLLLDVRAILLEPLQPEQRSAALFLQGAQRHRQRQCHVELLAVILLAGASENRQPFGQIANIIALD